MTGLALALGAFTLAAAVNTVSVALEHRRGWLSRRFGARAWWIHLLVITPGWALFVWAAVVVGEPIAWPLPEALWVLGPPTALVGITLAGAGFALLGVVTALNGATFGRGSRRATQRGVFARLSHPIYDGFALIFAGVGLTTTNVAYLVLALASCGLLNGCEARIENQALEPRSGSDSV